MDYILYFSLELWSNTQTLDLTKIKVFHMHIRTCQIFSSSYSQSEICILHATWPLTLTWQFYGIQIIT